MSIIADALKKAELDKQVKKSPAQNTVTTSVESVHDFKRPEPVQVKVIKGKWSVSLFFVLFAGLIVVAASLILTKQKSVIVVPVTTVPATAKQSVSGIEFSFNVQPKSVTLASMNPAQSQKEIEKPVVSEVAIPVVVQAAVPPEPAKSEFVLSGIIDDPKKPAAIINNEIVEVGGVVDGAKVIRIDSRGAVLEKNNLEISLSL